MADNEIDLAQQLDIVELIFHSIVRQENQELSQKLEQFKAENVQWVLNKISGPIEELYDDLETAYDRCIRF